MRELDFWESGGTKATKIQPRKRRHSLARRASAGRSGKWERIPNGTRSCAHSFSRWWNACSKLTTTRGQGDLQKTATPEAPNAGNVARERAHRWRSETTARLSAAEGHLRPQPPRPEVC